MNNLSLRDIQLLELDILEHIVQFFKKHDINYILVGGSMLGAVRHQGFIPWDDDIDILVPRSDYDRLRKLLIDSNSREIVPGIDIRLPGDENFPYSYIKAVNKRYQVIDEYREAPIIDYIWVDIFPLDHFPDNTKLHKKWVRKLQFENAILASNTLSVTYLRKKGYYSSIIKRIELTASKLLYNILGKTTGVSLLIDKTAKKMNKKFINSSHVGDGAYPNGMKDYFEISDCFPTIGADFEGRQFNIPKNYDSYLTKFYGDYMQIPDVSQRITHHITVIDTQCNQAEEQ